MSNFDQIMRQAQQMQQKMKKLQEELAERTVESESGGGMVTAVVNGKLELVSLKIQPKVVDPEDVEIVDSLRRLSGKSGGRPLFSLNASVADAVTLLENRIQGCAQLDLRLGKIPEIEGDAAALSQIVMALLTNAVEAIERKGARGNITLATFANDTLATLRITDDGVGIDADLLPTVCDPFVTTKQGQVGAGLGLHAARQAIEAQGGNVRIQSEPGKGASVTVDFKLAVRATEPQAL